MACGNKSRHYGTVGDNHVEWIDNNSDSVIVNTSITGNNKPTESGRCPLNSPSLSHNKDEEYDNMRGFDPASEDDMPDNGMSRYMENNDEEGWD